MALWFSYIGSFVNGLMMWCWLALKGSSDHIYNQLARRCIEQASNWANKNRDFYCWPHTIGHTRLPLATITVNLSTCDTIQFTLSYVCNYMIKIYSLRHGESFHPSLLAFFFDWWTKWWEVAEEVLMNCTAFTYYVTLMAKRTYAWLCHPLKLLPGALLLCTDSSQPGWVSCWDLYACSRAVICQYSWCYQWLW